MHENQKSGATTHENRVTGGGMDDCCRPQAQPRSRCMCWVLHRRYREKRREIANRMRRHLYNITMRYAVAELIVGNFDDECVRHWKRKSVIGTASIPDVLSTWFVLNIRHTHHMPPLRCHCVHLFSVFWKRRKKHNDRIRKSGRIQRHLAVVNACTFTFVIEFLARLSYALNPRQTRPTFFLEKKMYAPFEGSSVIRPDILAQLMWRLRAQSAG